MIIGVLALQGAFREHLAMLESIGVEGRRVRTAQDLAQVNALVLPGGESTTMARLAARSGLLQRVRTRMDAGMPVLGTCAGLILLADRVTDPGTLGELPTVGGLRVSVRRNAYGAQLASGEHDVTLNSGDSMRGVFIRAPRIEEFGEGVEVRAMLGGTPVIVQKGSIIGCAFHPELAGDARLHRWLADAVAAARPVVSAPGQATLG